MITWPRLTFPRTAAVCLLLTLFGSGALAEKASELPKPTSYVSDLAGVIDADSKQKMEDLSLELYEKAHATIEIVTVKSLEGESIEQFTTDLEDNWHVGPKGSDKGIVMVFAIGDHKRRIEVGYGLEGILNDAKVGDVGRSMVPQLQQGQYGPAIYSGQQQIASVIADDAKVDLYGGVQQHTYHREVVRHSRGPGWFGILVFLFIVAFIFIAGRRGGGGGFGGGGGLPWLLLGALLNGRRDYGGGGFGGGGSGGGFDGGSSGGGNDDFGGGFGGDSGGGGASGDW